MFALELNRDNDLGNMRAPLARQTLHDAHDFERNLLWQSLAVRTDGLQAKRAVNPAMSELGYGPAAQAPAANQSQAPAAKIPPAYQVQAGPVVALACAQPPRGEVKQAQTDSIAALDYTVERLHDAIAMRDTMGFVPHDVDGALARFFKGFGDDFLDDILARIQPVSGWIPTVPVYESAYERGKVPPGCPDAAVLNNPNVTPTAHTIIRRVFGNLMAPGRADFVVVFPPWYADLKLQAPALLHECFHFLFVGMFHTKNPLNDAFAWQGFVSQVGGLPLGPKVTHRYPPVK
jgi:hypothetical protein